MVDLVTVLKINIFIFCLDIFLVLGEKINENFNAAVNKLSYYATVGCCGARFACPSHPLLPKFPPSPSGLQIQHNSQTHWALKFPTPTRPTTPSFLNIYSYFFINIIINIYKHKK